MSGISGINSILGSVMLSSTSAKTGSTASAASSNTSGVSGWTDKMTISQIRDKVDEMAMSGQLTTKQQMSLITAGFQDLNAGDKSYQPPVAVGDLSRDTVGTFDPAAIMQQRSEFYSANNNTGVAVTLKSLADLFQAKEVSDGFSVTT